MVGDACKFKMTMKGKPEDVDTFLSYLTSEDPFVWIISATAKEGEDGTKSIRISGECAPPVYSGICIGKGVPADAPGGPCVEVRSDEPFVVFYLASLAQGWGR